MIPPGGPDWERLIDALDLTEDFAFLGVQAGNVEAERALIAGLPARLPERILRTLEIEPSDAPAALQVVLRAAPKEGEILVLTVTQAALFSDDLDRFFILLNQKRDELGRRALGPVLLVMHPSGWTKLRNRAPDLYSIHQVMFRFDPMPPAVQPLSELQLPAPLWQVEALPRAEVQPPEPQPQWDPLPPLPEREEELRLLKEAIRTSSVVVLYGPAGVGKTTLLRALTEPAKSEFPTVVFLSLGGQHDPFPAWRRVFQAVYPAAPVSPEAAAGLYASVTRSQRLLILADDVEDAAFLAALRPEGPSVLVATTRSSLSLPDSRWVRVMPRPGWTPVVEPPPTLPPLSDAALRLARSCARRDRVQVDLLREAWEEAGQGQFVAQREDGQALSFVQVLEEASAVLRVADGWVEVPADLRPLLLSPSLPPDPGLEAIEEVIPRVQGRWARARARGPTDFFLSYRTHRRAEVLPLVEALREAECSVWRDEDNIRETDEITEGVRQGLSKARVLIVWGSPDYHHSRICQIELRAAWIAAQQVGKPRERVFFILPTGVQVHQLPPLRADADIVPFSAPTDTSGWRKLAEDLRSRLPADGQRLGALRPIEATAPWWPSRQEAFNRFVGRETQLWRLHGMLLRDRQAAVNAAQRGGPVQLHGLGGVGKSTLAVEYARLFEAAWPGGIFYLKLSDGQGQQQREAGLARRMGLAGSTDTHLAAALQRLLKMKTEPYLWILDGVPSESTLGQVQEQCAPGGAGCTLITTRSRAWDSLGISLPLDVLSEEDALHLLLHHRNGKPVESEAAAKELCKKVGFLPLALDLLGAMQRDYALDESKWVYRMDNPQEDVLEWAADLEIELPTGCSRSIAEVMWQSLRRLKEGSWRLLLFLAVLADAPVPQGFAEEAMEGERAYRAGVSELRRHSLLSEHGLRIHALLRRVLLRDGKRKEQREEGRKRLVGLLIRDLKAVDPEDVRTHGPVLELLPHVVAVVGECEGEPEAKLMLRAAILWYSRGDYKAARAGCERALNAYTRVLGPEHPRTLDTIQHLAVVLLALGDLSGARQFGEQALEAQTRILGPYHRDTLGTLGNLALTLHALGDFGAAQRCYTQVLVAQPHLLGPEHPDTLNTLQNYSNTLHALGDQTGAQNLRLRVLAAGARSPEHPDTLRAAKSVAATLYARGNLAEARAIYEQTHSVQTRILGHEHPDTLASLQNLAETLKAQGDLDGARRLEEQALEVRTRVSGPEHPETLGILQNLAGTLHLQGDLVGARHRYEQALEAQTRLLGPEHPDSLRTLQNLAGTLLAQGDVAGARLRYEHALAAYARLLDAEHPSTNITRYNLILTLLQLDPPAARQHITLLSQLEQRPLENLAATDRQILAELPKLKAAAGMPA